MVYPGFSKEGGINNGCLLSLYEHTFLFTKTKQSKIVLLQKDLFFYIASQGTGARPPLILWHGSHGPRGPHATYAYVNNGGRQVTEKPFTSKWKKEMRDG